MVRLNSLIVFGLLGGILVVLEPCRSIGRQDFKPLAASVQFGDPHSRWGDVLKKYVKVQGPASQVDYRILKKNPSELNAYVESVETVTLHDFDGLTEKDKLAFLINAYNALTIKLIVDHYPVKSIKDIGGLFSNPWKMKFFKLFGEKHALDDIEHEMIRKKFNEPRIHFALVCASKGCPPLRQEPYVADRLDAQLEEQAIIFLRDKSKNHFDVQSGAVNLSGIFKWYHDDFEKKFKDVKEFVAPRMSSSGRERDLIKESTTKINYLDGQYDWSLNEAPQ